jgi:DNA polymerase/3'-5' exonuclease PolX
MDKSQVTDILEEIAVLLELKGENPFKSRAYTNGARTLDTYEGDLGKLVAENRLGELAGIGDALQKKITELVTTGRLGYYEDLRASVPAGMLAMIEIPSLGASTRTSSRSAPPAACAAGAKLCTTSTSSPRHAVPRTSWTTSSRCRG